MRSRQKLPIEDVLDTGLPRAYDKPLFEQKCSALSEHIYESYSERRGRLRRLIQKSPRHEALKAAVHRGAGTGSDGRIPWPGETVPKRHHCFVDLDYLAFGGLAVGPNYALWLHHRWLGSRLEQFATITEDLK